MSDSRPMRGIRMRGMCGPRRPATVPTTPPIDPALAAAMIAVASGIPVEDGVRITYDENGRATMQQLPRCALCAGDVVIKNPQNSPQQKLVNRRALELTPMLRPMSPAMAEMQRTGNYPTLEQQLAGRGPIQVDRR